MAVDFSISDYLHPVDILRRRVEAGRCQWWSSSRLHEAQASRLAAMVAHAYREVPYYRRVMDEARIGPGDIRHVEDLAALPTLSKGDLASARDKLTARHAARYRPRSARTSGTTGPPVEFLLDKSARSLEFVYYWRHWSSLGYRLGASFAELSSVYFLKHPTRQHDAYHFEPLTRRLLLNSLRLSAEVIPVWAAAFARYQPQYLKGLASALHACACLWEQHAAPYRLRGAFSNGDTLLSLHRHRIAAAFGCQVLDSYGHMERTFAVSECPQGGYHINTDYGVMELLPIDPPPRQGPAPTTQRCRVVGTSLHNMAMPLIRYEVGDLVDVDATSRECPCGRGFPLIRAILGRENDCIETPDGRVVSSMFVVFDMVEHVADGQIVQTDPDRCEIRVVPATGFTQEDAAVLQRLASRMLGERMRVDVILLEPGAIRPDASGKTRRVVSQVPAHVVRSRH